MNPVLIIAEAGVNHNGNLALAKRLVDVAVAAGADAVKFQTFKAEKLVTRQAAKAEYQKQTTGQNESQFAMLQKLELTHTEHRQLRDYCHACKIQFMSTAFDSDSLDFLVRELGVTRLKIPSGEIGNGPFLLAHAHYGLPILLSTGMADLGEIETALGVLAFGLLNQTATPSVSAFKAAYSSSAGQAALKQYVTLLHCTSEYPTPMAHVQLRAMDTLHNAFGLPVGYSDHTQGLTIPVAAVARGATVIEKHFTLDRSLQGPDHLVSLEPQELKTMVQSVRDIAAALGEALKTPQPQELLNRQVARQSLVAATEIRNGETFSVENLTTKRPGTGISPMEYWRYLGETSRRDYQPDDLIQP
jgi:N-acetylneuraminate synthase